MLRKGVPSTFSNVKSLYRDPAKRMVIEQLVESYRTEKAQVNGDASNPTQASSWEISVLYFLAQHYNFRLTRDLRKALAHTDHLIELAPKTYDWHMTKARIHKNLGEPTQAAVQMDTARKLDLRDRWINSKCAKYHLRNNANDAAISIMSKFTRNEVVGGTLGDLTEMQALWYLTEDGEAYLRQGRYGLALKRFHTIWGIFEQWQEDQFDFHTFSLRKAQIRAYVDMLRWEDRLRSHPYYARASLDAIRVYLALHEDPALATISELPRGLDISLASDAKAIKKARQEEEKADLAQRETDRKAAAKRNNLGQDGDVKKTDSDPKGLSLVRTKTPLDDCMKFLVPLIEFGGRDLEAQKVAFEVFIRRKRPFLALRHLLAAFTITKNDAELHVLAVRFRHELNMAADAPTLLSTMVKKSMPYPYNDTGVTKDLLALNNAFIKDHSGSVVHACAYTKVNSLLKPAEKIDTTIIIEALEKDQDLELDDVVKALRVVKECSAGTEQLREVATSGTNALGFGKEAIERVVKSAS